MLPRLLPGTIPPKIQSLMYSATPESVTLFFKTCYTLGKCFGKMYSFWENVLFFGKCTLFWKMYSFWENVLFLDLFQIGPIWELQILGPFYFCIILQPYQLF